VVLIAGPYLMMSVVYNHTASFFIFAISGFGLIPLVEATVQRRFVPRGRSSRGSHPQNSSALSDKSVASNRLGMRLGQHGPDSTS
jgi:hypothetical protein